VKAPMKTDRTELQFLPVSINITGKRIVLIGGGKVAFHKATILRRFVGEATVIAPEFHPEWESLPFELRRKTYEPEDLDGAFLVYICTGNQALNATVKADCEQRKILANVCDNPALCDFISPAIHKEGPVTIAVSSNAQDVRRSIAIRNRIKTWVENGKIGIQ
jgi:siroheme synthase-like protein